VTNNGELSGSYDVTLKIDDSIEATNNITLAGGASQNVTFAVSKYIANTYSVNVNEVSGTFVVKSIPTLPPVVSPPPTPAPTVPAAIDVPWKELRAFLLSSNASAPLASSARKAGIRVGTASLRFSSLTFTLNAFSTTDYGLIYVDDYKVDGKFLIWSIDVKSYFCLALPITQLDIRYYHDQAWWDNLTSAYGVQIPSASGEKLWDSPTEVNIVW